MNVKKLIATMTVASFLISSTIAPIVYSMGERAYAGEQLMDASEALSIVGSLGRITEARYFGSDTVVIDIQDLHCHAEVQRNIKEILKKLDEKYGIPKVYVEGGIGPVDTSWVNAIRSGKVRRKVVETLVSGGKLTGTEYYAIESGRNDLLIGLEEGGMYRENVERLKKIMTRRSETNGWIVPELKAGLETVQERYYSTRNRNLEEMRKNYREGKISAAKYYRTLFKYCRTVKAGKDEYPGLWKYMLVVEQERHLRPRQVERELQAYNRELKQVVPYNEYRFLQETMGGGGRMDDLYGEMMKAGKKYGVKTEGTYPGLNEFFNYLELNEQINPIELLKEEKRLVNEVRRDVAKSGGEREVCWLVELEGYLEEYLDNRIGAEDYAYLQAHMEQLKILWRKYVSAAGLPGEAEWAELMGRYYEVNVARNEYFLKTMLGEKGTKIAPDMTATDNDHAARVTGTMAGKKIVVMVAGGFHSEGVAKLLEERGISYLVITPNVTHDTKYSERMYDRLALEQEILIARQTLALELYSQKLLDKDATVDDIRLAREAVEDKVGLLFRELGKDPEKIEKAMEKYFEEFKKEYGFNFKYEREHKEQGYYHFRYEYKDKRGENGAERLQTVMLRYDIGKDLMEVLKEGKEEQEPIRTVQDKGNESINSDDGMNDGLANMFVGKAARILNLNKVFRRLERKEVVLKVLERERLRIQHDKNMALQKLFANSTFKTQLSDQDRKIGGIDTHMHTITGSDGVESVEAQIDAAVAAGIKVIQITEHDSVASLRRAIAHVNSLNEQIPYEIDKIVLVPAVEVTVDRKNGYHIVVSNIDIERMAPFLEKSGKLKNALIAARTRQERFVRKIDETGFTFEDLDFANLEKRLAKERSSMDAIELRKEDFVLLPLEKIKANMNEIFQYSEGANPAKLRTGEMILRNILTESSYKVVTGKLIAGVGRLNTSEALNIVLGDIYNNEEVIQRAIAEEGVAERDISIAELLKEVHDQGGKAIFTHPFRHFELGVALTRMLADNVDDKELASRVRRAIAEGTDPGLTSMVELIQQWKGLDGISTNYYYEGSTEKSNNLNRIARIVAADMGLTYLPAGETDCHGAMHGSTEYRLVGKAAGIPNSESVMKEFKQTWFRLQREESDLIKEKMRVGAARNYMAGNKPNGYWLRGALSRNNVLKNFVRLYHELMSWWSEILLANGAAWVLSKYHDAVNRWSTASRVGAAVRKLRSIDFENGGLVFDIDGTLIFGKGELIARAREKLNREDFPRESDWAKAVEELAAKQEAEQIETVAKLLGGLLGRTRVAIISGNDEGRQHKRLIQPLFNYLQTLEDGEERMKNFTFYANGGATKFTNYHFEAGELLMDRTIMEEAEFGEENVRKLAGYLHELVNRKDRNLLELYRESILTNEAIDPGLKKEIAGDTNSVAVLLKEWFRDQERVWGPPISSEWLDGKEEIIQQAPAGTPTRTFPSLELRGTPVVQAAMYPFPATFVFGSAPLLPEIIDRDAFIKEYPGTLPEQRGLLKHDVKDVTAAQLVDFLNGLIAVHDLNSILAGNAEYQPGQMTLANADERARNKLLLAEMFPGTLKNSVNKEYTGKRIELGRMLWRTIIKEIQDRNIVDERLFINSGGEISIDVGSGKDFALNDFIDSSARKSLNFAYFGNDFLWDGNDHRTLKVGGVTILNVGRAILDDAIKAKIAKGQFLQAGISPEDTWAVLRELTEGKQRAGHSMKVATGAIQAAMANVFNKMNQLSFRYGAHSSRMPGIDAAVRKIETISPEKGGFVSDIDGTLLQRKEDLIKEVRKKLSARKFPYENAREDAVQILAEELDRRQVEKAVRLLSDQLAYTRVAIISGNDEEVQHERLIRPLFDHLRQLEDGAQRMQNFTFYVNGGATKKVNYHFEDDELVMDTATKKELEFSDESLRKLNGFLSTLLPRVPDILSEIIAENRDIPENLRKEIAGNANATRTLLQEWIKDKTLERITPADSGWTEGQKWEIQPGKDGSFTQTLPWIELRGMEGTQDARPVQVTIKPLPRSFVYGAEPFLPENIDRDAFIREYRGGKSALPGLTLDSVKDMTQEEIARYLNELYAIHDLNKYLSLTAKHRLATVRPAEADERAQNKKLLAAQFPGTLRNSGINEYTGTTIDIGNALRKRVKDEILKENFLDAHLLLSLGGNTSVNIGSGKNTALQDFIADNDLDPAQIVYAGDSFSPDGNDYLVLQIQGVTIISVGSIKTDPVIEDRRAKGEFIQAGSSASDLLGILKIVSAGRRNSEQPGRRSAGTGAVKQALQAVTPASVLRGKALQKTVEGDTSADISRFAFRKEAYVISSASYDETVVERARGLAERGLQVLVSMPLEDGAAAGLIELGGEASNANLGGQVARVWAREMGSLTVLYYKSVNEAVPVDSRRFGIAAVKLLYDNPQLREQLGLRERPFKVGVFEMDDPLGHPAIVEGGLNGSEFLEDAVMVLNSGSVEMFREVPAGLGIDPRYVKEVNGRRFVDGTLAAKLFDVQLQGQDENDGLLRTIESVWKKKREVKYIKDVPLSSVTVDVARQGAELRELVNERFLAQLNEAQIDTVVLKGLAWQLDENERQQLLSVTRKLHKAGKRVVVEYKVTQDADRAALLLAGRKAMKMGADGIRADMSNYKGNMLAAVDDLMMLRRIALRADPDAIVAVVLSEHTDFKGYGLFDAGIKRVVRYFPGQQLAGMQPGTWLEVAEPSRFRGDEEILAGIFRKLVENEHAEMIGMDYELLNAAVLKAAPRTFTEVFGAIFVQWRRKAVNTPEFRYRQGYHAGWNIEDKRLPGNVDRFYDVLKAGTPDEFIERFNSVFAELPGTDKQAWEGVSDTVREPALDPETATLQWNEARGNVEGLMARVELSRYTDKDGPFTYKKDRELFGWLLVQTKLKGIALPEDLKTMPLDAKREYYAVLSARYTGTGELKDTLARIRRLESRLANGATLGDTDSELREEMNELYAMIKEEKEKQPLAITELLKLLDLYADRDIKALQYLKRESLEALPAAIKAIQSAA